MTSRTEYSTQTPNKPSVFDVQYLRNHRNLDIGVLGYIGIVWSKENSPEVRSFPPGTPCIYIYIYIYIYIHIFKSLLKARHLTSRLQWVHTSAVGFSGTFRGCCDAYIGWRIGSSVKAVATAWNYQSFFVNFYWHFRITEKTENHFFVIKLNRCTNFTNLFCHVTLHVSDSSFVHHEEFIHCALGNGICHRGL